MRKNNWKLELWTDIKWVRFGRTELSISGSDAEFWDLSFEKGPWLPGSHLDRKKEEKLFEKNKSSSFWRFFVTKSVALRFYELSLSGSDAEFWDLSFAMGPGAQFFEKLIIFFKKLSIVGTFWESKMGEKVKCLMKWVRIAPNLEILIRIDAPGSRDLKNAGFGQLSPILGGQKIWSKIYFFFFGYFWASRVLLLAPINPELTWN